MKTTTKLLAGAMIIMFCSIGNAQLGISYTNALSGGTLIYSNAFNGGAVLINGTPPTLATDLFGATNNALWDSVSNGVGPVVYMYQNGTFGVGLNSVLLPFTPQPGIVYTLSGSVTLPAMTAGKWIALGFGEFYPTNIAGARFDDAPVHGNPWCYITEGSGGEVFFPTESTSVGPATDLTPTPGTYTVQLVLDTTGATNWVGTTNWIAAEFVDGTQSATNYVYANPNPPIKSAGVGQTTLNSSTGIQWDYLTISANQLVMTRGPVSANVNEGSAFTNSVVMGGTPPFQYQWFTNGVSLVNGGGISGATNASLVLNPVSASNAGSDYYCVVTNAYGAVTSTPASLVVYSTPTFLSANPVTYTNLMTLFGGTGAYLGSSPAFSVNAGGQVPLTYYWLTNGVAVGGANGVSFTFTNCQMDSPNSFTCIVSNSLGTATNTWVAQYIPTPTAPYPQLVIADSPIGYWRLDETNYDVDQYNDGEVCNDFMSGNNGLYTNTELAQSPGYYVTLPTGAYFTNDPNEIAADFGPPNPFPSEAFSVGTNVDFSAPANAEFTVSVWANGGYQGTATEPANGGLVAKGTNGAEEFALDDGASGADARFLVRNTAGTASSASSTLQLGTINQWYHLVGVCDESNGVINLYINGLLTVQAAITKGSGVEPDAAVPITIGADSSGQFVGGLDDVAIFNYAMNANQVGQLYAAAGGVNPLTFVAPLTPTNVVWRQNTTLTIPAFAVGAPPLGYYWTNLTTDAIVGGTGVKGATGTSAVASLTCTLTITNAPPSYSGDELELVVTNAISSTNLFVTLFSYPPPITIGYTNSILYSNEFNGGTWNLAGTATTLANSLVGGTNTTWIDALGTNDTGSLEGSGLDNTTLGDSWLLPFTPEPGFVYTMTSEVTFYSNPGNWVGIGFAQTIPTNATGSARMDDGNVSGIDWLLLNDVSTANAEWFGGPIGALPFYNANNSFPAGAGTNTMVVILDTTGAQWVTTAYINGVSLGTNTYPSNPTITGAGITQNTVTIPNDVQWNDWSLTAVSPNGFAPYLITAPSTNSITLTNSTTLTLSASGIGTGPWGYYWSDNSTVIASGATNSTAPVNATLSVPESSLSAGPLTLTMTNALGTNITLIALLSLLPTTGTNIMWGVTNGNLYMSWPTAYTGWQLQAQTNSLSVGLSTNWANYNPSTGTNQVVIPINLTNGTVFYRLMY